MKSWPFFAKKASFSEYNLVMPKNLGAVSQSSNFYGFC